MEHLFVRLSPASSRTEATILTADGHRTRPTASIDLAGIAALAEGRRVSVLLPSDRTVVLAAEIPKTSAARMRSLLPFSLEDHFATDVEELHFAAGPALADGRITTTVVEHRQLADWLRQLTDAGLSPNAVYADCEGVPDTPSTVALILDGTAVLGRRPGEPPFQLEGLTLDEIGALLAGGHEEDTSPKHVMVYGTREDLAAHAAEIDAMRDEIEDVDIRELRDGPTALLASTLSARPGTNLLQGEFAPKSNLRAAARPWYAAAGLALTLVAAVVAGAGVDLLRLRQTDAALADETRSLCASRFGSPLESACRAEVQRRLASIGQSAESAQESFLSTLNLVAQSTGATSFEALSYRNQTLDLDIHVRDVEALDQFARQVADTDRFEVRTLSNTPQDDGLRSRVQVVRTP